MNYGIFFFFYLIYSYVVSGEYLAIYLVLFHTLADSLLHKMLSLRQLPTLLPPSLPALAKCFFFACAVKEYSFSISMSVVSKYIAGK